MIECFVEVLVIEWVECLTSIELCQHKTAMPLV